MATKAVIKCENCGNVFDVYIQSFDYDVPIKCPHCLKEMDKSMQSDLKNAMLTVDDLNYHFLKYNQERKEPLFSVSFDYTRVPTDKF